MRPRARPSPRVVRRAGLVATAAVLIGSCSGDLLTLGRAPLDNTGGTGPGEAGTDTGVPDTSAETGPETGPDTGEAGPDVDGGPPPVFDPPQDPGSINDAASDDATDNPTLTRLMDRIYFSSTRATGDGGPGSSNIWTAVSLMRDGKFEPPTLVESADPSNPVNTDEAEQSPSISADGETLWFGRRLPDAKEEDEPGVEIMVSRLMPNGTWSAPEYVEELNTSANDIPRPPALVEGLLVMPLASRMGTVNYQNYFSTSNGTTWGDRIPLIQLNDTAFENVDGFLRADAAGTEFYFSSTRAASEPMSAQTQDLYFVRATSGSGPLAERFLASSVQKLNVSSYDGFELYKDPWVSEDGSWLYFTTFDDNREKIFYARRSVTPEP